MKQVYEYYLKKMKEAETIKDITKYARRANEALKAYLETEEWSLF